MAGRLKGSITAPCVYYLVRALSEASIYLWKEGF